MRHISRPELPENPRERMVVTAALLLREHGVEGTSFSQVIAESGAPRGSIYHYFPGGKAQLIEEATRFAGEYIAQGMVATLESGDPMDFLELSRTFWTDLLGRSEFREGCPVVASTLDGERSPRAR